VSAAIPQADPGRSYRAQAAEIDAAVARVLAGGRYVLGEEVEAFERELAASLAARFAVAVNSGTDALTIALRSAGVGRGDEVITVSHTATATVAAIEAAGASAVLVDVDDRTMTMAPDALEEAIGPRTKAVVPVHLYGHPAAMEEIAGIARRNGLRILEDACQAQGATLGGKAAGTLGDAAAFSFYPTKNLGAFGDGGAIVTDDASIASAARSLRQYGWSSERVAERAGFNSRLDALQAAILRVKLRALPAAVGRRRTIAAAYGRGLADSNLRLPSEASGARHAFHLFVVRAADRESLARELERDGIGTAVHYRVPVHQQPAYAGRLRTASLRVTERLFGEVLSLPLYPELADHEVQRVIEAVLRASAARR